MINYQYACYFSSWYTVMGTLSSGKVVQHAILVKRHASQAMVCGLQKEEGFAKSMAQRLTEVSSVLQRRCVASKVVSLIQNLKTL